MNNGTYHVTEREHEISSSQQNNSARNNGRSAFSDRQESVLECQDTIFTDLVDRQENPFRYPFVVAPYLKLKVY